MIITVQQHIVQEQEAVSPGSRGTFSWLLAGITLATKMIQARVRRAGLLDALGSAGETNVQGEVQQKLDVYANQMLLHCLGRRDALRYAVMIRRALLRANQIKRDGASARRSPGTHKIPN